jgi:hypothetical protein
VNEAPKDGNTPITSEIDLSSQDKDITIGTEKYHFTKLDGAKINIENATENSTSQPKVSYTHGNDLNYADAEKTQTWGAASASNETPGSGD